MQYNGKISEDNRGFSLLELIVTVVILALVTAPFLSSFVTASDTNVKAKRIQEANELGQYVIEECKAMSFDKISTMYTVSSGTKTLGDISETDYNEYNENSTYYEWEIKGTDLPSGYSEKYTADVKITPVKSVVNSDEAIPLIDNINKKRCAVLRDKIYKYDSVYAPISRKELTVNIGCTINATTGDKKYIVQYFLQYYDGATLKGTIGEKFEYNEIPDIYILYTPKSSEDKIKINNNINISDLSGSKINLYLMEQECTTSPLNAINIVFNEIGHLYSDINLHNLMNNNSAAGAGYALKNTVIYTNVDVSSITDITDRDNTANINMKTVKIDTLYNIDVLIKYSGKEISKFSSTKLQFNK